MMPDKKTAKPTQKYISGFRPGMTLQEIDRLRYPPVAKPLGPAGSGDVTPPQSAIAPDRKLANGGAVRGNGCCMKAKKCKMR
jgi:hypothetical protein